MTIGNIQTLSVIPTFDRSNDVIESSQNARRVIPMFDRLNDLTETRHNA